MLSFVWLKAAELRHVLVRWSIFLGMPKMSPWLPGFSLPVGNGSQGRLLHILPAEEAPEPRTKPSTDDGDSVGSPHRSSFQAKHQENLKSTAGVGHNWNALFIRPDAVATYLAAKFGLTKVRHWASFFDLFAIIIFATQRLGSARIACQIALHGSFANLGISSMIQRMS